MLSTAGKLKTEIPEYMYVDVNRPAVDDLPASNIQNRKRRKFERDPTRDREALHYMGVEKNIEISSIALILRVPRCAWISRAPRNASSDENVPI
jgi:hypothetical protein